MRPASIFRPPCSRSFFAVSAFLESTPATSGFPIRQQVWDRLAGDLKPRHLAKVTRTISLDELAGAFDAFIKGQIKGRTVVRVVA